MSIEAAVEALQRMTPKRWLVAAALTCICGLISATVCCIGCSIHETNRWGQPENFVTHLWASGTYLSLIVSMFSAAVFLVSLGYLLFNRPNRTSGK